MESKTQRSDLGIIGYSETFSLIKTWFFSVLKPDELVKVSQWADSKRYLSTKASAEAGQWRTSRTPYTQAIMDDLSVTDPCQEIVVMFGAQLGKSETGNNWVGYVIDVCPAPMLMVQPTVDIAKRYSTQRLAPMINDSPSLREKVKENKSKNGKNTILSKEYPGGILMLAGSNSAAGLRSMPIKYLFLDEIDAYPVDVDGEGDPVELAKARTRTFARRKMLFTSTPTDKKTSRIEKLYLETDQRKYFVPCPCCQTMHTLEWSNFIIPKTESGEKDWRNAHMACPHCGIVIEEWQKTDMLSKGNWIPTNESKIDRKRKGYHMNALYSPVGWYSWQDIARKWIESQGNPLMLKEFVNTVLAETWEEKGERVEVHSLESRCEDLSPDTLPEGCHMVTIGADVQADRIELEWVGWGKGEETWSLGYEILKGDPTQDAVWKLLDLHLSKTWMHQKGIRVRAFRTFIDSGNGNHVSRIYDYARTRRHLEVYACKGASTNRHPVCGEKSFQKKSNIDIYLIGTIAAKDLIYGRLGIKEHGPGYMHFPKGRSKEWFEQLTSEESTIVKGEKTYRKIRNRNEALDCRVYATGAMYSLSLKIDEIANLIEQKSVGLSTKKERTVREIEN